jgi:hypothetical protein
MTAQQKLQTACDTARRLAKGFAEEAPALVEEALARIDDMEAGLAGATRAHEGVPCGWLCRTRAGGRRSGDAAERDG